MRLIYLAPAALTVLLVGCGPDEPEEVTPPPAAPEQQVPATPPAGDTQSGTETGPASGDIQIDKAVSPGNSPGTEEMQNQQGAGTTPPAGGTSQ